MSTLFKLYWILLEGPAGGQLSINARAPFVAQISFATFAEPSKLISSSPLMICPASGEVMVTFILSVSACPTALRSCGAVFCAATVFLLHAPCREKGKAYCQYDDQLHETNDPLVEYIFFYRRCLYQNKSKADHTYGREILKPAPFPQCTRGAPS